MFPRRTEVSTGMIASRTYSKSVHRIIPCFLIVNSSASETGGLGQVRRAGGVDHGNYFEVKPEEKYSSVPAPSRTVIPEGGKSKTR